MREHVHESTTGSVRFHRIGAIEFWLTPMNRIFLVVAGRSIFPSLQGSTVVRFDDPRYKPEAAVTDKLRELLRKQRDIRAGWPSLEEDETAYEFSAA